MKVVLVALALGLAVLGLMSLPGRVRCQEHVGLPDAACTPGAIDPAVTQENIQSTICKPGWASSGRPPVAYTNRLKPQSIKDYGYTDKNPSHYEEDHLISLELGGHPTDTQNLWAEPQASPNPKDSIEDALHTEVCTGRISLSEAQRRIATDWTKALN